jgi:hypothetical protein
VIAVSRVSPLWEFPVLLFPTRSLLLCPPGPSDCYQQVKSNLGAGHTTPQEAGDSLLYVKINFQGEAEALCQTLVINY